MFKIERSPTLTEAIFTQNTRQLFRIDSEHRKALAVRMKELGASQRPIAQALGVGQATVSRDLDDSHESSEDSHRFIEAAISANSDSNESLQPSPKAWFQEPDRKVVQQAITGVRRQVKEQERQSRRDVEVVDLLDQVMQRPHGGDHKSEDFNVNNVNVDRPVGNSASNALRRLRKARPDLHRRVIAGELSP